MPKANTVKNSEQTRVHEHYILPGQQRTILSPFCFGSFVIPASVLHGKVFIGHETQFMRKANLEQLHTYNVLDLEFSCKWRRTAFDLWDKIKVIQYTIKYEP